MPNAANNQHTTFLVPSGYLPEPPPLVRLCAAKSCKAGYTLVPALAIDPASFCGRGKKKRSSAGCDILLVEPPVWFEGKSQSPQLLPGFTFTLLLELTLLLEPRLLFALSIARPIPKTTVRWWISGYASSYGPSPYSLPNLKAGQAGGFTI